MAWEDGPDSGTVACNQEIQNRGTEGLQPVGKGFSGGSAWSARSSETSSGRQDSFVFCGVGVSLVRLSSALVVRPYEEHIVL